MITTEAETIDADPLAFIEPSRMRLFRRVARRRRRCGRHAVSSARELAEASPLGRIFRLNPKERPRGEWRGA
jgi:hypothetical protein